jgi:hypothetical protein
VVREKSPAVAAVTLPQLSPPAWTAAQSYVLRKSKDKKRQRQEIWNGRKVLRGGSKRVRQHGWCASTASLGWRLNFNGGSFRVLTWLRQWRSIVTVQLVPGPRRRLGSPCVFPSCTLQHLLPNTTRSVPRCRNQARDAAANTHTPLSSVDHISFLPPNALPAFRAQYHGFATARLSCTPTKVVYPRQPGCQSPLTARSRISTFCQYWHTCGLHPAKQSRQRFCFAAGFLCIPEFG